MERMKVNMSTFSSIASPAESTAAAWPQEMMRANTEGLMMFNFIIKKQRHIKIPSQHLGGGICIALRTVVGWLLTKVSCFDRLFREPVMMMDVIAGKRPMGGVMSFLCRRLCTHNIQKRYRRRAMGIKVTSRGVCAMDELAGLDNGRDRVHLTLSMMY